MSDWYWSPDVNRHGKDFWNGRHPAMHCYIQRSTYDTRRTSTTFWIPGQRVSSDKWLDDEPFTTFDEAKQWIETQDPLEIYHYYCKTKTIRAIKRIPHNWRTP